MRDTLDPFTWDENEEDEVRAACDCGWTGSWREWIKEVRADERGHDCKYTTEWRES